LVIAQMALAVIVLAGAGLLIRTVENLRSIDPGLKVDGLAVIDAVMPGRLTADQRRRAIQDTLSSLQALPGVTSVAAAQKLPMTGSGDNWQIAVRGRPPLNASTGFRMVTSDYFTTLHIPILRGRNFDFHDRENTERVVIINKALADRFFSGEDPVGQVLETFDGGERIVGVASNVLEGGLTDGPIPARYMLDEQVPPRANASFVLRIQNPDRMTALLVEARSTITEGRQFAIDRTTTMRNILDLAMGPTAQVVTLLSLLGVLALILGSVGVYGVIWHYVLRRSRDYAVRIALGEQPSRVLWRVVGRGAALVAAGSAIGVGASFPLAHLLSSLLYGIEPTDPLVLSAAVAVLLLIGILAAFVPARRASLTDPAEVLRGT
jgi:predicted permease